MAHGIIREHEGAITVDSKPGRGTLFTIYLPLSDA
jgi:signal transduction histidine kinase